MPSTRHARRSRSLPAGRSHAGHVPRRCVNRERNECPCAGPCTCPKHLVPTGFPRGSFSARHDGSRRLSVRSIVSRVCHKPGDDGVLPSRVYGSPSGHCAGHTARFYFPWIRLQPNVAKRVLDFTLVLGLRLTFLQVEGNQSEKR